KECAVISLSRDQFDVFAKTLERLSIPLVIFSAGVGDVIQLVLAHDLGRLPSNIHVVSNFMNFDTEGKICAFKPPLLHTFNKGTAVINGQSTFASDLRRRPNVLLLGDSLGDLHMDSGLVNEDCILKIGFLNGRVHSDVNESFSQFVNGYDIVIIDDQTFDVPNSLLSAIVESATMY
ncbi:unnamed protein product, partial [Soboliphyme baturini]|uniref:5'-nucleotidase n=1 Tax=Soboliphyme baturini TaxID=241478 RepID=A0A183I9Y3_9BILA